MEGSRRHVVSRRHLMQLTARTAILPVAPRFAWAQAYPARPVHVIVGYAPGGVADIYARLMAQWLSERLGEQLVVENRPGSAGNVAAEVVAKSRPDGYTLLMIGSNNAINATLYDKLPFDFLRDIAPVAGVARAAMVMEVNPSVPAKTVPELVAYAKANPGKLNMGSGGIGSTPHVAGELFKMMAGIQMVHVPYRGTGAMFADFLGGQVQIAFDNLPSSIGYIRDGRLRALAVTSAAQLDALPDVPSVGEFVPGYEAISWTGVGAPRNTPADVIDRLNAQINAAFADPGFKARLADLGAMAHTGSASEFGKFIAADTEKWAKVIKFAGIKPE